MRVFHFTKEKIAQLKAKANAEAKTHKISSLQAIGVVRMKAVELLEGGIGKGAEEMNKML
ncbi:hypothetical protein Ahy_A01g003051 [Arachis hypogaea]|uniref:Uncharacterized protein n=1 Tax=Arachis hypogaea TaxID=3818 RepID=A0A445ESD6_ARAHY|nr:hypothetical protein Ahy_A01g003051 [Arachis hypogaea]